MTLQERIAHEAQQARKSGDSHRRLVLSMLQSAIHNRAIERKKQDEGLLDEEVTDVIAAEAKKRKDAIEAYEAARKTERAAAEQQELAVLQEYLPQQLTREEVAQELSALIADEGDVSTNDLGRLMGAAMQRLKGKADGNIVREELSKLLSEK